MRNKLERHFFSPAYKKTIRNVFLKILGNPTKCPDMRSKKCNEGAGHLPNAKSSLRALEQKNSQKTSHSK